jgi:SAM-dependent methyltransferase
MTSTHLDLGCGPTPRNPYHRARLFGVDIAPPAPAQGIEVRRANLAIEPIPYADSMFDSVSAFDFFEHVPRVLPLADGSGTRFPFIELMNEISRVLRPGGLLYALTPCYPAMEAFSDPTHVNVMTLRSHLYFTGNAPLGRMYGFTGQFALRRAEWAVHKDSLDARAEPSFARRLRILTRRLKGKLTHMAWEFESTKTA